eukprot:2450029-Pleurochrysis_carterae.AAC.1
MFVVIITVTCVTFGISLQPSKAAVKARPLQFPKPLQQGNCALRLTSKRGEDLLRRGLSVRCARRDASRGGRGCGERSRRVRRRHALRDRASPRGD